jgi:xylose isomerase
MPENTFTFGLWTVGNPGRDPFGEPVRQPMSPVRIVHLLADVGAMGVNFHDNDLVPISATPAERDQIVKDFKKALTDTGLEVPMATTNLFTDPAFKDGAFTSNDAKVRAFALQKTMRSMDLGYELGARIYVMWGGREGVETDATKNPLDAMKRDARRRRFPLRTTRATGSMTTSSRWRRSRTSRAATSTCRRPAPCSASLRRSRTRRWSA